MSGTPSKYYKLAIGEGLEALLAKDYNHSFPFHFHPTYNITLVYLGSFNTQLHNQLLIAPTGSILITNPQEIHANPFEKDNKVSFFTFYVSQDFMEYCNGGQSVVFNNKVINDDDLFSALHQLATTINHPQLGSTYEDELKKALHTLALNYGDNHNEPQDLQFKSLFDDFMAEESITKFSLDVAASRFGIDKYKFIRLFKSQTGLTPNNYFILKRIEKSKTMLAEGKDLLSIAIDLGFYDTAHYCNHFKKFTGISPIAYSTNI
ncbi:AraC family transcriptional regulator [Pedobacter boryungensis]|uniref:Helix-turn-helix transcriptional regulator n=1 Tax=Pedobacter boryungensis TaxID=869962 RepID=A0ABX2DF86_9SPHI|nr:AraC family transcriptional regulator [Pedobacter boryungensis]NQX32650.1 helix-turn-helix transcriptional regulator [Pedobacter boryungensis]